MNLALAAFTQLAEGMVRWEVDQLARPQTPGQRGTRNYALGIAARLLRRGRAENPIAAITSTGSAAAVACARRARSVRHDDRRHVFSGSASGGGDRPGFTAGTKWFWAA